ncbi:hypothetical protein [Asanoa iriomotensis]|uniref:Uncharacterized protein n=1 Tax=Asanoa iriomotensis TaxID=234613 RepID=A0ABQ4BUT9_9ACTN|nr:hypothetical protein [Asanoa iriomotensis]GIF54283.1 hypothetical protein Air01nite_03780 [Asanoa iriomotensis]
MAHSRFLRLAGLAAGLFAAWLLTAGDEAGLRPAFAVPVLAALLAAGLLTADRTVARPVGTGVRSARLVRRRTLDLVPAVPATGVALLTVALGGLLGVTGPASTPHTRSMSIPNNPLDGRHIGCVSGGIAQSGPWPGWFYAIPIGATLVLAAIAAVVALRRVVTRPVDGPAGDAYRRDTAVSIVAALGVLVGTSVAGAAHFTHSVLGQPLVCADPVAQEARPWLVALMVVGVVATAYYAVRLVFPSAAATAGPVRSVVPAR